MKKKSMLLKAGSIILCSTLLFSCSQNTDSTNESSTIAAVNTETLSTIGDKEVSAVIGETVSYSDDDFYTDWENENPTYIELNGTSASFDGAGAVFVSNNVVTIRAAGVYVISGNLDDGQIIVDAEDKGTVKLVLNGASINNRNQAPIYVKNAGKAIVSLPEGTDNTLSDGTEYVLEDSSDEPNAALFSKDNLTINGTGKLTVHGNYNNGITSKDELRITGGTIEIDSVDDGLMGRDVVAVKEGSITIKAGGDGIKASNDKDTSKGNIALEGGTYDITASSDGMQAEASLLIADGDYTITSGGGSPETIASKGNDMRPTGNESTTTTTTETETESAKGLKATVDIAIGGGSFKIDSSDDAVHSNNSVTIAGGEITIASGDDGIHGDTAVLTKGGKINITKSYEGIESKVISIANGEIDVTASDDGINVGGGNDSSGMDFQSTETEDNLLSISGGTVTVNAAGDGLDSNGSIQMTDGTVLVSGPTDNGNGSLDYDQSFEMTGGFLIAAGSAGMVQATSEQSTQNAIVMTYPDTQAAGTLLHVEDSDGNTVATFAPEKDYQAVFISSPNLEKDKDYTLYSGGTSTGEEADGLYSDGTYNGGTKVVEFTISDSVTWLNESGVTTANTSGPGGGGMRGGGQRPDRGQRPPTGEAPDGSQTPTTDQ
ncbi:carbohydrate-binding domain-containing protein [Neobacillus sp. 3P2-tot-E-2]|uniref:carbohydrate-binding domain-containing protein n=1 Tax=Neobacillus sp. 3P2-tot-E-2 TaxID=3132212 RepID=UPI0039A38A59